MKNLSATIAHFRKAIAPLIALIAEAVNADLVHGTAFKVATLIITAAGLIGVVASPPNAPAPTKK